MSYRARIYRHRNPQAQEEKPQPFFSRHDQNKNKQSDSFFQTKLAINKPGDQYEKEADSVANAVMSQSGNKPIVQQKEISAIQRLSSSEEDESETFFLSDTSVASQSIKDLMTALRGVLEDDIGDADELMIGFEDLRLDISEVS